MYLKSCYGDNVFVNDDDIFVCSPLHFLFPSPIVSHGTFISMRASKWAHSTISKSYSISGAHIHTAYARKHFAVCHFQATNGGCCFAFSQLSIIQSGAPNNGKDSCFQFKNMIVFGLTKLARQQCGADNRFEFFCIKKGRRRKM